MWHNSSGENKKRWKKKNLWKNKKCWSELVRTCEYSAHTFSRNFIPGNQTTRVSNEAWSAKRVKCPKRQPGQAVCDHQSFGVSKMNWGWWCSPDWASQLGHKETDCCPLLQGTTCMGWPTWTSYWLQIRVWVSMYSEVWDTDLQEPQSSFPTSNPHSSGNYLTEKEVFTVESLPIAASLVSSAYGISALSYNSVILNSNIWNMNFAQKTGTDLQNMLKPNHWATLSQTD